MKGAVAAGSKLTVEAGLHVLRQGGNAIDAAIASTIMAGVAEPLLSGIGGAGMATVRFNGQFHCVDFFANMPGLAQDDDKQRPMDEVAINFGPTTQTFLVGKGSAAVPGMAAGIHALHERFGKLPLHALVEPAVEAGRNGVPVTPGFERVCELLWPILALTEPVHTLFSKNGRPLKAGDTFYCPQLSDSLHEFGRDGVRYFTHGAGAQALLSHLGTHSRLTPTDLHQQAARICPALPVRYRDAILWVPNAPSAAGLSVAHTLAAVENGGPIDQPTSIDTISRVAEALNSTFSIRRKPFMRDLFTEGFGGSFLARVQASREPKTGISPGHTTHISTADEAGNAVSITHSLGETAGEMAGDTGILINNFLGEADVNPPNFTRPPGGRLITMCCPSILEMADGRIVALGSGGSSRIPTAVLHGTIYMTDANWAATDAVAGPRTHTEGGPIHVETWDRSEATLGQLQERFPDHIQFDGPNMFFGGLHMAGIGPNGFCGSGDARRSGTYGTTG